MSLSLLGKSSVNVDCARNGLKHVCSNLLQLHPLHSRLHDPLTARQVYQVELCKALFGLVHLAKLFFQASSPQQQHPKILIIRDAEIEEML